MRWLRRKSAPEPVDPGVQEAAFQQLRQQFGVHVRMPYAQQVAGVTQLLAADDGLRLAARILQEMADEAFAGVRAQIDPKYAVDRKDYRPLWRWAGTGLRTPRYNLPSGVYPYVHLPAALDVLAANAKRVVKSAPPGPLLSNLFQLLDLLTAGWEFGKVPVDPEGADLARRFIASGSKLRTAVGDEPPALPNPIRELMRRNNTIEVLDATGRGRVGTINLGGEMRPAFLI
jgi:hypothetical protein